jgi:CRISPR-associated Csx11 family protein
MTETLANHRNLVLAMECIGWLHMTGKAATIFLKFPEYDYKNWFKQEGVDIVAYFKWLESNLQEAYNQWNLSGSPPTLTNLIGNFFNKFTRAGEKNLVGLLQAAHGIASGIEKNLPNNPSRYLGQDATHLWLASAFGHPERNLLADPPPVLQEGGWQQLLQRIESLLTELERKGRNGVTDREEWHRWREEAIGPEGWLRQAFSSTLAETRLPNNDVTLWDQSYVAASLFKSAVAGALLEGRNFKWQSDHKQNTRWRLLTVGIGAEHYEDRAVRVGDWQGARLVLHSFFREVKKYVETELALGNSLYEDGRVMVFSFPGEHQEDTGGNVNGLSHQEAQELRSLIAERIDRIAWEHKLETPPYCRISEPTRSLIPLAREARIVGDQLAVPCHRAWTIPDPGDPANDHSSEETSHIGHICPVCGVRRGLLEEDDRAPKTKTCGPCGERRYNRLRHWEKGNYGRDTIWFSEVADRNDRLALITLNFDLEPWLGGWAMDSLRAQAASEWARHNPVVQEYGIRPASAYEDLFCYVKKRIEETPDWSDPVLRQLHEGFQHESGNSWKPFFEKIVEDRAPDATQKQDWDKLTPEKRARWLVHQLLRKHASPGRVHRFWRTSEAFLEGLLDDFCQLAARSSNRWRVRRLILTATDPDGGSFLDGEVYNGHLRGQPVGLLYREETGRFITVSNLERILGDDESPSVLQEQELDVRDEEKNQLRRIRIESAEKAVDALGVYTPLLALDRSPDRLRLLVPLEHVPDCLDLAIGRWKERFARVWDRMPLYAGVVAFPRKMPYQAVIEATRNLEDQLIPSSEKLEKKLQTWRVLDTESREGIKSLRLAPQKGGEELVSIPVRLPDGRTDVFYPYCLVENACIQWRRDFAHPETGALYRHMGDLQRGDALKVLPARFAWQFLDNARRRFEGVNVQPLSRWGKMRRLWDLVCQTAPSMSAVQNVAGMLDTTWKEWRDFQGAENSWRELARALLSERWDVAGAALDELVEAAASGELRDCLEWHLGVLKTSTQEQIHDYTKL